MASVSFVAAFWVTVIAGSAVEAASRCGMSGKLGVPGTPGTPKAAWAESYHAFGVSALSALVLLSNRIAEHADLLDLDFDHIASLQETRWLHCHTNAMRSSR